MRFDEYGNTGPLRKAAPATTTKNLNGTTTNRGALKAVPDPTAPAGVTRYVLASGGPALVDNGPQNRTGSTDGLTFDVMAIPKEVTWRQNGLRKAATLGATLKYVDLPFDPRLARAVSIELLLGCVDYETAASQASGDWRGQDAPVIPRTYVGPYGEPRTNVRFQGFVDEWESVWDDGEPLVRIECTDNTQLLIDQEAPPRLVLDMTKPLDLAVAGYLANFVQLEGLSVQYLPVGDSAPVLGRILAGTAYRPNLGPQPSKGGSGSGDTKTSVLDYLTECCGVAGHSVRVLGTSVVIQRARSILTNSTTPRPTDPFTPRTIAGRSYPNRVFVYGRNLKEFRMKREFRKHAPQCVEVRTYLQEKKTVLVARYPKVSAAPSTQKTPVRALPGNTQPDQKWSVIHVAGVRDQPTLNKIAQEYYEALGRQELGVSLRTENLSSFGGGNTDPDVLDLQFGDTFNVFVNRDPGSSLTNIEQLLGAAGSAQSFMQRLGFSPEFAAAYAQAYDNAGFQYSFRLHTMQVEWSGETGCKIGLSGVNYVEIRADQVLPPGQEPNNTALQPSPPKAVPE